VLSLRGKVSQSLRNCVVEQVQKWIQVQKQNCRPLVGVGSGIGDVRGHQCGPQCCCKS